VRQLDVALSVVVGVIVLLLIKELNLNCDTCLARTAEIALLHLNSVKVWKQMFKLRSETL